MKVIVNYASPATLNYTFVTVNEKIFTYTIYYYDGDKQVLAIARSIPLP